MADTEDKKLDKMTEEMAEQIGQVYKESGNEMRNIILGYLVARLTLKKRNEALDKIDVVIAEAQSKTDAILDDIIPKAFNYGVSSADAYLPPALKKIPMSPFFKDQIVLMIEDAKIDFGFGLGGARKVAHTVLSEAMKEQLVNTIATGTVQGKGIPKITKDVLGLLGDEGFTTFVTRNGKVWPLDYYSEMLTRTHVIRAANESTVARARQLDINILEMSEHAGVKDQACLDVQGKLFDLTGKEYPMPPTMPIHPNCKHKLFLKPELSMKKNTK